MSHDNFPARFGFEPDLRQSIGKTIECVEIVAMEWGCTWRSAYAVRFTDGTRAFFAGQAGTGIMNPQLDGQTYSDVRTVETSAIFTKREYADMLVAKEADKLRRQKEQERHERLEFERLAAKFSPGSPHEPD